MEYKISIVQTNWGRRRRKFLQRQESFIQEYSTIDIKQKIWFISQIISSTNWNILPTIIVSIELLSVQVV